MYYQKMLKLILILVLLRSAVSIRFLVIGDWGTGDTTQGLVANAMRHYVNSNEVDFIIATGDNFYPDGVASATDSKFYDRWRDMYTGSLSNLDWYISMGNHDHNLYGNEKYQIDFGVSEKRWILPDYKFSFTKSLESEKAVFISYDSESVLKDKHDAAGIVDFVRTTLRDNPDPKTWKFVFGHHPAYSCAKRTINPDIESAIVSLMDEYEADVYWAGHEHNLQHLRRTGNSLNVDHIISGGGGKNTYPFCPSCCQIVNDAGVELHDFREENGFVAVDLHDKTMKVSFRNTANEEIYSYTRIKN